jgi:hypothetical protein
VLQPAASAEEVGDAEGEDEVAVDEAVLVGVTVVEIGPDEVDVGAIEVVELALELAVVVVVVVVERVEDDNGLVDDVNEDEELVLELVVIVLDIEDEGAGVLLVAVPVVVVGGGTLPGPAITSWYGTAWSAPEYAVKTVAPLGVPSLDH